MIEYPGNKNAGMVELVDSVDLGSTAKSVQVRVLLPAPETPRCGSDKRIIDNN